MLPAWTQRNTSTPTNPLVNRCGPEPKIFCINNDGLAFGMAATRETENG
jgi:hypothetical protein